MAFNEKHTGLDTMYDNAHGEESISIMNALSGILNNARDMGASEADCEEVRAEILTAIMFKNYKEIKKHLAARGYLVRIDGGFMDVGYLLSLRF